MKNLIYKNALIAGAIAFSSVFISCDDEETTGLDLVAKTTASTTVTSLTLTEGDSAVIPFTIANPISKVSQFKIELMNSTLSQGDLSSGDQEMDADTGEAGNGFEITVPAFASSFDIPVNAIADILAENTESAVLKISAAGVRTILIDGGFASVNLTIADDGLACPWSLQEIGDATWSGTNVPGAGPDTASIITTSYDGTTLTMQGLAHAWVEDTAYWDEVITATTPVVFEIHLDGSITIAKQFTCSTTWNGAPQPDYSVEATGTFDTCTKTLVINYDLIQDDNVTDSGVETITMD